MSRGQMIKEKERKLAKLDSKMKDMEDEKLILMEQNKEEMKSKQNIFQY